MRISHIHVGEDSRMHRIDAVQEKRDMHSCSLAQCNQQPCMILCVCHVFLDQLIPLVGTFPACRSV